MPGIEPISDLFAAANRDTFAALYNSYPIGLTDILGETKPSGPEPKPRDYFAEALQELDDFIERRA